MTFAAARVWSSSPPSSALPSEGRCLEDVDVARDGSIGTYRVTPPECWGASESKSGSPNACARSIARNPGGSQPGMTSARPSDPR